MKSGKPGSVSGVQEALACLAVPSRFRLVRAIAEAERCVGELAISVGLSQSCTTRHLQALERAGLVEGSREGRRVRFSLRSDEEWAAGVLRLALEGTGWRSPPPVAPRSTRSRGERRAKSLPKGPMAVGSADGGPADAGVPTEAPRPTQLPRIQELEDYLL